LLGTDGGSYHASGGDYGERGCTGAKGFIAHSAFAGDDRSVDERELPLLFQPDNGIAFHEL
jgi:hypothetical protein